MIKRPKISVITIVYNRVFDIDITLKSVVHQTYKKLEYIVIDGDSNDGTLDVINKYKNEIDVLVSEKDNGIYDAMNKGISKATGDYILFMNGGDEFLNVNTLKNVFHDKNFDFQDIIYGETYVINENRLKIDLLSNITNRKLPNVLNKFTYKNGSNICHQSFIVKKRIVPLYDMTYSIVADLKWMITCMDRSESCLQSERPIAMFLDGGLSNVYRRKAMIERFKLFSEIYGYYHSIVYHFKIILNNISRN